MLFWIVADRSDNPLLITNQVDNRHCWRRRWWWQKAVVSCHLKLSFCCWWTVLRNQISPSRIQPSRTIFDWSMQFGLLADFLDFNYMVCFTVVVVVVVLIIDQQQFSWNWDHCCLNNSISNWRIRNNRFWRHQV